MTWNWRETARRLRPHWNPIVTNARQQGALRVIYVPQSIGPPRVEIHIGPDTVGPLPAMRPLKFAGIEARLAYVRSEPLRLRAPVPYGGTLAGTSATLKAGSALMQRSSDLGSGNFGTAGWNFRMGSDAYVLGNRHVLRSLGVDDAPLHPATSPSSPIADLCYYEGVDPSQNAKNFWDLAIAKFRDPSAALPSYAFGVTDYPRSIASNVRSEQPCYKVGATTKQTKGKLYGSGYELSLDLFSDGTTYDFAEQMYFEMEADGGDSGSVIVRRAGHALIGLLMGIIRNAKVTEVEADGSEVVRTTQLAVANPLLSYGLTITDPRSGDQLPSVELKAGALAGNLVKV